MTVIHTFVSSPAAYNSTIFNMAVDMQKPSLPKPMQTRVDKMFEKFSKSALALGKQVANEMICTVKNLKVMPLGLEGSCITAPYDEVLYFSRARIPYEHYNYGAINIGNPLAAGGIFVTNDLKILFIKKSGCERAYSNEPYSIIGGMASANKSLENGKISLELLLSQCIGNEVGEKIWNARTEMNYLGTTIIAQNSGTINNGTEMFWEIMLNFGHEEVLRNFTSNPQFAQKSAIQFVDGNPKDLIGFAASNPMTAAGLSSLFTYIGSRFGNAELIKQYPYYRDTGKGRRLKHNFAYIN